MSIGAMMRVGACMLPLQILLPVDSDLRMCYSDRELVALYGLQKMDPAYVAQILPPAPDPYPVALAPEDDPLMRVLLQKASEQEIELVARTTAEKVQAFWAAEFAARGGVYTPAEVIFEPCAARSPNEPPHRELGTRYEDGVVYVDCLEIKDSSVTWRPVDLRAVKLWVAHEIAHHVMDLTGVRAAAYARAIIEEADISADLEGLPEGLYLAGRREYLADKPDFPISVYIEQQAQYLAALSLRKAGLLHLGDPVQMYYVSVTQGDDYGRVTETKPPEIVLPLSPVFFKRSSSHGWGKDMAKAAYAGLLPASSVDAGLELLGVKPDFHNHAPQGL